MAHTKSAKKRIRSDARKRERNAYHIKSCRTFIKKFYKGSNQGLKQRSFIISLLDKLVAKKIWHRKKVARLKSYLMKKKIST